MVILHGLQLDDVGDSKLNEQLEGAMDMLGEAVKGSSWSFR